MRAIVRVCIPAVASAVLALSMPGVASADPGRGCTFFGVSPPGTFISSVAHAGLQGADFNPGNAKDPRPPAVPREDGPADCNPTLNPVPPNPQF
jgi:hypothetical protein